MRLLARIGLIFLIVVVTDFVVESIIGGVISLTEFEKGIFVGSISTSALWWLDDLLP